MLLPRLPVAFLLVTFSLCAQAQTIPLPFIDQPLVPSAVKPGSPAFTLAINGTGFLADSVVLWNGASKPTTYVSRGRLTAAISAADVTVPHPVLVSVRNGPGKESAATPFLVTTPRSVTAFNYTPLPVQGYLVATGDLNGDGRMDIVSAQQSSFTNMSSLSLLIGNGDGNFQSPLLIDGEVLWPSQILTADFNNDGKTDLLLLYNFGFPGFGYDLLYLGNGDGTFQPPLQVQALGAAATVADFDRDGNLDLAVVSFDSEYAPARWAVMLGNGDGTFSAGFSTDLNAPNVHGSVVAADFNRDGLLDVAVTVGDNVLVYLGDGSGSFELASTTGEAGFPIGPLVSADLNGDGIVDMAGLVESQDPGVPSSVFLFLGNGDGTFALTPLRPTLSGTFETMLAGDFNGDGKVDLVVGSSDENVPDLGGVDIFHGNADGTFQPPQIFSGAQPQLFAAADFNNDGRLDLATVGSSVGVLLQGSIYSYPSGITFPTSTFNTVGRPLATTLTNISQSPLPITSAAISGVNAGDFNLVSDACSGQVLAAGATCSLSVDFQPVSDNLRLATLAVTSPSLLQPQTVELDGFGSFLETTPKALWLGSIPVGAPFTKDITLTNTATKGLSFYLNLSGEDVEDFTTSGCENVIGAARSCLIHVTFAPAQAGLRNATLMIVQTANNEKGLTQTVPLAGTGY